MDNRLLSLLRCPVCDGDLTYRPLEQLAGQGVLGHEANECDEHFPVIDGIPRLLVGEARGRLVRARREWFAASPNRTHIAEQWTTRAGDDPVIAGFDDEWQRFRDVGTKDHSDVFALYFDLLPPALLGASQTVLDAGCGGGRWAFEVSNRGPRVIAVDLGQSVEVARANTDPTRVDCVQADLQGLPLHPASVDWAYSLGVLHHTHAPQRALDDVVRAVRPGGVVLLYLYYALDQRGPLYRGIFRVVDMTRRVLSRQPRPMVRAVAAAIAVLVYWPLARAGAVLERLGMGRLASRLPLAFYRHLSFATMLNDSIDRFGTRLERRYTRAEMTALMRSAGLVDVVISEAWPFWHGVGKKPMPPRRPS